MTYVWSALLVIGLIIVPRLIIGIAWFRRSRARAMNRNDPSPAVKASPLGTQVIPWLVAFLIGLALAAAALVVLNVQRTWSRESSVGAPSGSCFDISGYDHPTDSVRPMGSSGSTGRSWRAVPVDGGSKPRGRGNPGVLGFESYVRTPLSTLIEAG